MGAWPCPSENPAGAASTPRNQATSLTGLIGPDEETILKRSMLKLQRPASERKRQNSGPIDGCGPARTRGCWHPRGLLELGIDFQVAISADPASRAPPTSGAPASWLQVGFPACCPQPPARSGRLLLGDCVPVPELAWLHFLPPLCLQLMEILPGTYAFLPTSSTGQTKTFANLDDGHVAFPNGHAAKPVFVCLFCFC